MDAALAAYLPRDRRRALAHGTSLPYRPHGAALFADISGFTPLTEALALSLGRRQGAEAITLQINAVYDVLIAAVERYGGSVLSFAGDANTCWFDEAEGAAPLRAAACAMAMQQAMAVFRAISLPDGRRAALALKVVATSAPRGASSSATGPSSA